MLFVRPLTLNEAEQLQVGITSAHPFTSRRCQIVLASAQGEKAKAIHTRLGCSHDAVREAIHAFNRDGLQCLHERRHALRFIVDKSQAQSISRILQTSPRRFGKKKRRWTLELLAEVCCEQGLATRVISREGMRQAIERLGIQWPLNRYGVSSSASQTGAFNNCSSPRLLRLGRWLTLRSSTRKNAFGHVPERS